LGGFFFLFCFSFFFFVFFFFLFYYFFVFFVVFCFFVVVGSVVVFCVFLAGGTFPRRGDTAHMHTATLFAPLCSTYFLSRQLFAPRQIRACSRRLRSWRPQAIRRRRGSAIPSPRLRLNRLFSLVGTSPERSLNVMACSGSPCAILAEIFATHQQFGRSSWNGASSSASATAPIRISSQIILSISTTTCPSGVVLRKSMRLCEFAQRKCCGDSNVSGGSFRLRC